MEKNLNIFRDNAINSINQGRSNYTQGQSFELKQEGYQSFKQGVLGLIQYVKKEPTETLKKIVQDKLKILLDELIYMKDQLDQYAKQNPVGQQNTQPQLQNTSNSLQEPNKNDTGSSQDFIDSAIVVSVQNSLNWNDVAGLDNVKKSLQEVIILPVKFPELFQGGLKPWMGTLLYGPPGTGKTFLAKACANQARCQFISVSLSDLKSRQVSESKKLIKSLFQMARDGKPSIIFINEIDIFCGSENEAIRKMKKEFLVQIQDAVNNNEGVYAIGKTNKPWNLDQGVKNSFEKRIYVPHPNPLGRLQFLRNRLKDIPNNINEEELNYLVKQLDGYSFYDLNTMIIDATFEPLRKCQSAKYFKQIQTPDGTKYTPCPPSDHQGQPMTMFQIQTGQIHLNLLEIDDFFSVLPKFKPSVSKEELKKYHDWNSQFGMGDV